MRAQTSINIANKKKQSNSCWFPYGHHGVCLPVLSTIENDENERMRMMQTKE